MKIKLVSLIEEHAKEISQWRYEEPYSVYNYIDWNTMFTLGWGITQKEKREKEFLAVVNERKELFGYIRLVEKRDGIIIGIGLRPDLCGKGIGQQVMMLLKEERMKRYGNKKIILEVRSFNSRAINCYKKVGFTETDRYIRNTPKGEAEFIKMISFN